MKNAIINNCLNLIKRNNNYTDIKLAEIKYGLESIYLTISKLIIITLLAWYLGIVKEFIFFALIYNIIRMPSFGLHATKSWICLVSSTIIFIGAPLLSIYLSVNLYLKSFLLIICLLLFFKNSPADTKKKPIVNPKRRLVYKFTTVIVAIILSFISLIITNNFASNIILLALIIQNFMISPTIYKLFGLPYNNYIEYIKLHPLNTV